MSGLFCPKCGSILAQKKTDSGTKIACKCGYTSTGELKVTEKVKMQKGIEVVEERKEILPVTSADCQKCGNNEAYYWLLQTRAGDEPETKFLRCTKCDHTWRDYS